MFINAASVVRVSGLYHTPNILYVMYASSSAPFILKLRLEQPAQGEYGWSFGVQNSGTRAAAARY
jgi:hypothetical protein